MKTIEDYKVSDVISLIQEGDTVLHHNRGFLPRNIRTQMNKYSKKTYGKVPDILFNHMDTAVRKDGTIQFGGAIREGYIIRPAEEVIRPDKLLDGTQIVMRPVTPFTDEEKERISAEALRIEVDNTPYEIWNFVWWLVYINTNFKIFIGKKGIDKVFCYEAAWHLLQSSGRQFIYKQEQFGTSVDMQYSDYFKQVEL